MQQEGWERKEVAQRLPPSGLALFQGLPVTSSPSQQQCVRGGGGPGEAGMGRYWPRKGMEAEGQSMLDVGFGESWTL